LTGAIASTVRSLHPLIVAAPASRYAEPQVTTEPKRTSLYSEHVALGARLVPFAGWEMPIQYKGIVAEHQAVRGRAGLFDVSHMGELRLRGEAASTTVNQLVTNDFARIEAGRAMYTCCCNLAGTILDDLIIYKYAEDDVLIVCNASNRDKMSAHFATAAVGRAEFKDESDETALLALQGPRAFAVLERARVDAPDLAAKLGSFRFTPGRIAGVACVIARTGYTGEDGVELFCAWNDAPELWRSLLTAGAEHGIEAVGLGARDTLRLEARLSLYGQEIDETTNPLEAGLAWTVKLDKGDFVGRDALLEIKSKGQSRRMVGFEMTGKGIARHGYPLCTKSGEVVGICTSGGPSPTLGKNIGLGYLPSAMADVGSEFAADCRGKLIPAVVVKTPFYKRASVG
jgi:aminomethyltransferase